MKAFWLILFAWLFLWGSAVAQEKKRTRLPLFVSHLSAEDAAITRRKGAPSHFFLTRVVCFHKKCRAFIGWRKGQRARQYDYTKPATLQKQATIQKDSARILPVKPLPKVPVKNKPLSPMPSRADSVIVLNELLFETNRYNLRQELYPLLDSIADYLQKESKASVTISGHTDNVGKEEYNLQLSSQRAEAVAEYLIDQNISPERLSFLGLGSAQPVQPNEILEGRKKNRRVEILIRYSR